MSQEKQRDAEDNSTGDYKKKNRKILLTHVRDKHFYCLREDGRNPHLLRDRDNRNPYSKTNNLVLQKK